MFQVHPNIASIINTTSIYPQAANNGLSGPGSSVLHAYQSGRGVTQGNQSLPSTGGSGGAHGGAAGPGGGPHGASGYDGPAPPPGGSGGSAGGAPAGNQERGRQPAGATGDSKVKDNLPGPALAPGPSSGTGQRAGDMHHKALSNFKGHPVPDKTKLGGCTTCVCKAKNKNKK